MKKTKRITALLLAAILSVGMLTACGKKEESSSESEYSYTEEPTTEAIDVKIPLSDSDCKNKDETDIAEEFQKAGFAVVEQEGLKDLLSKDKNSDKEYKATEVTVNGKKSFKKGDKVKSDVKVVIKYHSFNTIFMPFSSEEAVGMDYEDAITQLKEEGFTNFSTKKFEDNSKGKDSVKSISVNGETEFDSLSSFISDAKIVVSYYTEKSESSKSSDSKSSSQSSSQSSKSSSSKVDSGSVSPALKEYLDSYEAFIDKYVELMKNYNSDPMKYMTEYLDYMNKLSDFTDKLDEYDEDEMSTADWLYYMEVVNRVNKKLLEVQ